MSKEKKLKALDLIIENKIDIQVVSECADAESYNHRMIERYGRTYGGLFVVEEKDFKLIEGVVRECY